MKLNRRSRSQGGGGGGGGREVSLATVASRNLSLHSPRVSELDQGAASPGAGNADP